MARTMKIACLLCAVLAVSTHAVSAQSAYSSVMSGLTSNLGSYFTPAAMKSTTSSLSGLLLAYSNTAPGTTSSDPQFCSPASLVPAAKNPAVIISPSMTITLNTGSCQLMKSKIVSGLATVTCLPPTIDWVKTPLTYVAPFTSPAVFTTKECIAGKNLTVGSSQVLYTGGATVTYPTIQAWLESYKTGAYSMGMGPVAVDPAAVKYAPAAAVLVPAAATVPIPAPATVVPTVIPVTAPITIGPIFTSVPPAAATTAAAAAASTGAAAGDAASG